MFFLEGVLGAEGHFLGFFFTFFGLCVCCLLLLVLFENKQRSLLELACLAYCSISSGTKNRTCTFKNKFFKQEKCQKQKKHNGCYLLL